MTQPDKETKGAVAQFEKTRDHLLKFMEEHSSTMDEFFALVEDYNRTLSISKDLVRQHSDPGSFRLGPLARSAKPRYVKYDPKKVAPEVLRIPGVIKDLDYKKIDSLVAAGMIVEEDVAPAKTVTFGSARVTGPKEIIFKL